MPKIRLSGGRPGAFQVRFCRAGGMKAATPATSCSAAAADPGRLRPCRKRPYRGNVGGRTTRPDTPKNAPGWRRRDFAGGGSRLAGGEVVGAPGGGARRRPQPPPKTGRIGRISPIMPLEGVFVSGLAPGAELKFYRVYGALRRQKRRLAFCPLLRGGCNGSLSCGGADRRSVLHANALSLGKALVKKARK